MTPIYFKQRGAQVVLKADSIRVIVCRSIKSSIGKYYIPEGWDNAEFTIEGPRGQYKIRYIKGRYYFIREYNTNLSGIGNIDTYINEVVEDTNIYINHYL